MYKPDEITLIVSAGSAAIPVLVGATLIFVHEHPIGLALLVGGVIPLLSNLILLLRIHWGRRKATRGVLKVVPRGSDVIFNAIETDLKRAKTIQILGNILYTDLLRLLILIKY